MSKPISCILAGRCYKLGVHDVFYTRFLEELKNMFWIKVEWSGTLHSPPWLRPCIESFSISVYISLRYFLWYHILFHIIHPFSFTFKFTDVCFPKCICFPKLYLSIAISTGIPQNCRQSTEDCRNSIGYHQWLYTTFEFVSLWWTHGRFNDSSWR
jgi:hypothetical protein